MAQGDLIKLEGAHWLDLTPTAQQQDDVGFVRMNAERAIDLNAQNNRLSKFFHEMAQGFLGYDLNAAVLATYASVVTASPKQKAEAINNMRLTFYKAIERGALTAENTDIAANVLYGFAYAIDQSGPRSNERMGAIVDFMRCEDSLKRAGRWHVMEAVIPVMVDSGSSVFKEFGRKRNRELKAMRRFQRDTMAVAGQQLRRRQPTVG
jgi:hypothetical protein